MADKTKVTIHYIGRYPLQDSQKGYVMKRFQLTAAPAVFGHNAEYLELQDVGAFFRWCIIVSGWD